MRYREFGKENKDVILLLHGGGLSWWNYRGVAQGLQKDFRVILPILDGHAGSDREFTTIRDNAAEIAAFINENLEGSVLLIGGVSLGGQILLELLSQRPDICRYALVESALVIPSRLIRAMIRPAFGSCYPLIRQKWFAKLQFKYLRIPQELFDDYYRDTCRIQKESMIAFLEENAAYTLKDSLCSCKAKVHIFVGEKEAGAMKRSANMIHKKLPGSTLQILEDLHHGEFSLNCAEDYVKAIYEIVKRKNEEAI